MSQMLSSLNDYGLRMIDQDITTFLDQVLNQLPESEVI